MKKVISILMIIVMMVSSFSGCNKESKNIYITKGQWLHMINEAFGMYTYNQSEPYFINISVGDSYFVDVQIAKEWDIINNTDEKFDTEATVTNDFLAVTLVNAANLIGNGTVTITNPTKVNEPEKIAIAIENELFQMEDKEEFNANAKVNYNNASIALGKAVYLWANKTYDETVVNYKAKEGIADLTKIDLSPDQYTYNPIEREVTLPEEYVQDLKAGDIYIIPSTENNNPVETACKIDKIEFHDGYANITNTEGELSLEDVFDEVFIQSTVQPDLSKIDIVDGNGNPIKIETTASVMKNQDTEKQLSNLLYIKNNDITVQKLALTGKIDFNYGDFKISGIISDESIKFSVSGDSSSSNKAAKVKIDSSFEIKDIKLTTDFDYSWFTLHSATVKVDYSTVQKLCASFSMKKEGVFAPEHSNGNGKFHTNLKNAILKDKNGLGAKSIKIASLKIPTGVPGLYAGLDINLILSISGSATILITKSNTYGVEYKNNNIRIINDSTTDMETEVNAQIEGTIYVGASATLLGVSLAGAGIEGGLGVAFQMKANLVDADNKLLDTLEGDNGDVIETYVLDPLSISIPEAPEIQLHVDICNDLTTYGILKFKIDMNTALGKVLQGLKIKKGDGKEIGFTWDILNKKNATISKWHWEDGHRVDKCTRLYGDIDAVEEAVVIDDDTTVGVEEGSTEQTEIVKEGSGEQTEIGENINDNYATNNGIQQMLDISPYFIHISPGVTAKINVIQVPDGYDMSNIKFTVKDTSVASIDANGVVTGLAVGSTIIAAYTEDNEYRMECAITVTEDSIIVSEPLTF